MALDIYSTHYLLAAMEEITPPTTFLRDRYFPTNDATDLFKTRDVLIEYKDGNRKVAPFVAPRKKGITILRDGSTMKQYQPPLVAPRRVLTIDELNVRGFGEALMSQLTPEQRESVMAQRDLAELRDLIVRREEAMAGEILTTNKCVMKHYADDMKTVYDEKEIIFYEGSTNPASYTPATKWGTAGADIKADLYAMIMSLKRRGLPATEALVAEDVAAIILSDEKLLKELDANNYNVGNIDPVALPDGVSRLGTLNIMGNNLTIYCYTESYENDEGDDTKYIPAGHVVVTAPAAGRTMYGSITQMEQSDHKYYTYTGRVVPKYLADPENDVRTLTLSSAPLLIPNRLNPWIVSKVTK